MSRAVQPQQAQQYTQNVGGSVRQALGSVGSGDGI